MKKLAHAISPLFSNWSIKLLSSGLLLVLIFPWLTHVQIRAAEANQYFPQTGKTVSGKFLQYWQTNGGLATYGYPITEAQNEVDPETGKTFLTQWFERNRFELHPENAGTRYEVLLGLLGKDLKREALVVDPDFVRTEAVYDPAYAGEPQLYFPETGHNLKLRFARYWQQNGGLERFGYPISEAHEELDPETGRFFKMQWFERARFEYHPENKPPYDVLPGLLGKQIKQPRSGSVEVAWKISATDQMWAVNSMAINRWGNIYLVDGSRNNVRYYNPQGQLLGMWGITGTDPGQFNYPSSIALDQEDNVYIADAHNHRIQKFDREGTFLLEWGGSSQSEDSKSKDAPPAPGKFQYPMGIALDSQSNVYVTDGDNDRVQKFDKQGNFLLGWGSSGTEDGQFVGPEGIAIDSENNIYVSDFGDPGGKSGTAKDAFLQKFDSQGRFIKKWVLKTGAGEPALAIDSQDNIYVYTHSGEVQVLDKQGQFVTKWKASGSAITTGPDGKLYLAKATTSERLTSTLIYQYAPDGQLLGELKLKPKLGSGDFEGLRTIVLDQSGNLYMLNSSRNLVYKFDSTGRFLLQWSSGSRKGNEYKFLSSIAVDSQNRVYVAEVGSHTIYKYDSQGNLIAQWSLELGKEANPAEPMLITVASQGNLYAAVSESTNSQGGFTLKIVKYDSQGKFLLEWGSLGKEQGQFQQLEAITTDKDGNVFVSDTLHEGESSYLVGRVQKFDSTGRFLMQWKGGESKDWDLKNPSALTIDNQGRVFVGDARLNTVEVFDVEGQFITKFGSTGSADGQLNGPVGIALDSTGYIFVAEFGSQRVQKWKLQ